MHTRASLLEQLCRLPVGQTETVLVHSSMKSIGQVEGGADAVLDALSEWMRDGLLVLPAHTWSYISAENPRFSVQDSPSCVGVLTELFRKRPGVLRSAHPTHSVAALGKDAAWLASGDEKCDTPCARGSAWGKLLDRKAKILFIGVDLTCNTFMHGIEEWAGVPGRMTDHHEQLFTIFPDGREVLVPSRRHCGKPWSDYYDKVEMLFMMIGILKWGQIGDAQVRICDSAAMAELMLAMLQDEPDLFSGPDPIQPELIDKYRSWQPG